MKRSMVPALIGLVSVLLGLEVLLGWALTNLSMVQVIPGSVVMSVNTALFFVCIGSLLLHDFFGNPWRKLNTALCGVIIVGSILILIEHALDKSLGIDWNALHQTIQKGNVRAGRTAQNACLSFLLIGIFLFFKDQAPKKILSKWVKILVFITCLLSVFGFAGYALHIDLLYEWYQYHRIALPTALGIIMLSIGIYLRWKDVEGDSDCERKKEGDKITSVGTVLLILMGMVAGLSGLITFETQFLETFNHQVEIALKRRVDFFQTNLEYGIARSQSLVDLHDMMVYLESKVKHESHYNYELNSFKDADNAGKRPLNSRADIGLKDAENILVAQGFSGLSIYLPNGTLLATLGKPRSSSLFAINLIVPPSQVLSSQLVWDHKFILKNTVPVQNDNGALIAKVETEYPLSDLTEFFYDTKSVGKTVELGLCAPEHKMMIKCFPARLNGQVFTASRFKNERSQPMDMALGHEVGVEKIADYMGEKAIVAYSPVGDFGIAATFKIKSEELYAQIRQRLERVLLIIFILVAVGSITLRLSVKPLVIRLIKSEETAMEYARTLRQSEERLRLITDNLPILISYIDRNECYRFNNKTYEAWYGVSHDKIYGKHIKEILGDVDYENIKPKIDEAFSGKIVTFEQEFTQPNFPHFTLATYIPDFNKEVVMGCYVMISDISDRKMHEQYMTHLAHHDVLTGLANRGLFHDRLNQAMRRAERSKNIVALLYMDIDHFKTINDTMGHAAGDALLKQFAVRLSESVRSADTVCRLGGDEFTVIMEGILTHQDAENVAAKILAVMRNPFDLEGQACSITSSIGVAYFNADQMTEDELVRRADDALYQAKRLGRDRFEVAKS